MSVNQQSNTTNEVDMNSNTGWNLSKPAVCLNRQ